MLVMHQIMLLMIIVLCQFDQIWLMFNRRTKEKVSNEMNDNEWQYSLLEQEPSEKKQPRLMLAGFEVDGIGVISRSPIEIDEDMANALALSKRVFWQKMVATWHCDQGMLWGKVLDNFFEDRNNIFEKVMEKCEKWKAIVMAIDAYVKSWEWRQTASGEKSLNSLCVRPRIRVDLKYENEGENDADADENDTTASSSSTISNLTDKKKKQTHMELSQLLTSSLMEVAKAVYREVCIKKTKLKVVLEIKAFLANREEWDSVDQWIKHYQKWDEDLTNAVRSDRSRFEKEKQQFVKETSEILAGNNQDGTNFDAFLQLYPKVPPKRYGNAMNLSAEMHKTIEQKWSQLNRKYDQFLERIINLRDNQFEINQQNLMIVNQIYRELWELIQENGLIMASMCDAGTKFKSVFMKEKAKNNNDMDSKCSSALNLLFGTKDGKVMSFLKKVIIEETDEMQMERKLGQLLWVYKNEVQPMIGKKNKLDESKQLLVVRDPCEEEMAKLKVMIMGYKNFYLSN